MFAKLICWNVKRKPDNDSFLCLLLKFQLLKGDVRRGFQVIVSVHVRWRYGPFPSLIWFGHKFQVRVLFLYEVYFPESIGRIGGNNSKLIGSDINLVFDMSIGLLRSFLCHKGPFIARGVIIRVFRSGSFPIILQLHSCRHCQQPRKSWRNRKCARLGCNPLSPSDP